MTSANRFDHVVDQIALRAESRAPRRGRIRSSLARHHQRIHADLHRFRESSRRP
jgi:hypothetical protein